ncbi:S49 family peptidase [Chloroflexota bacterium]
MPTLERSKGLLRYCFTSIPFFVLLGIILGFVIAVPAIPRPKVAIIPISGAILDQTYTNNILETLRRAGNDNSIKAVVLQINSPGGGVAVIEQIYLDVLRLREKKPVVASVGSMAASGGYYIAVAAEDIYAPPTAQLGSIGVISSLPSPENINEETITSGLFKATGSSKRQLMTGVEIIRQEFVSTVISQRGARLKLSPEEISLARLYLGVDGLRVGLIDEIGTITGATEKAASLAGIKNYTVEKFEILQAASLFFFSSADMEKLKSQTSTTPAYYYLAFESE